MGWWEDQHNKIVPHIVPIEIIMPHKSRRAFNQYRRKRRQRNVAIKKKEYEATNEWRKNNPETSKEIARRYRLRKIYGITPEQYNDLLQRQGGTCAVCQRNAAQFPKQLAVDHDHKTLQIRGLLCTFCNRTIIGRLGEDKAEWLERAGRYLKQGTGLYVPEQRPKRRRRKKKR